MRDACKNLRVFHALMRGEVMDAGYKDAVRIENMLYSTFGMSSDEILDYFIGSEEVNMCK